MCERLNETTSLLLTHKDEVSDYKWQTGDKILVLYFDDLGQEHLEVFEYFNNEFSNGTSNFQELDDECCIIAWEKIEVETNPDKIDFIILFNYLGLSDITLKQIDFQGKDIVYYGDIPLPKNGKCLVVSSDGTVLEYEQKERKITLIKAGEDFVAFKEYQEEYSNFSYQSVCFKKVVDKVFVITDEQEQKSVRKFIRLRDWQKILRSYMPPKKYEEIIKIFTNSEGQRLTRKNIK